MIKRKIRALAQLFRAQKEIKTEKTAIINS